LPDSLRAATTGGFFLFTSQADETDPDMSFSLELLGGSFRVNGSARSGWEWKKNNTTTTSHPDTPIGACLK